MPSTATCTPNDEIEALAMAAAGGQWEAMGELYERHVDTTYRWAHSRIRDHATAEDITSEVWERVGKSIHAFVSRGPGSFVKWLFTITRVILVDYFRRVGRRRENFTADMLELDAVSKDESPDQVAERRELAEVMARAVRRLPARQAEVVRHRFYQGLTVAETAALMDLNANAVKQLQFRALTKLRSVMPAGGDRNLIMQVHVQVQDDAVLDEKAALREDDDTRR